MLARAGEELALVTLEGEEEARGQGALVLIRRELDAKAL